MDKPYPNQMGMHALLVQSGGIYEIAGSQSRAGKQYEQTDLYRLFGHAIGDYALELAGVYVPDHLYDTERRFWSALAIGDEYQAAANKLGLQPKMLRDEPPVVTDGVRLWFDSTQRTFAYLEDWQDKLFEQAVLRDDREVSELLIKCGSMTLKCAAAVVHTAETEEKREHMFNMFWRLMIRDNHFYDYSPEEFRTTLENMVADVYILGEKGS